ncbi:hypothetical protein C5167_027237 [Papaver somniferum]|nr:hypothetical protein C5167_027237 [Papaver somniferum]
MHTIPILLMDSLTTNLRNMNALAKADDSYYNKLICLLTTRCTTQDVYFCSGDLTPQEFMHYDVVVHTLLAAALGIYKLPPIFQDRPQLTRIADNFNYWHRNARSDGRASLG